MWHKARAGSDYAPNPGPAQTLYIQPERTHLNFTAKNQINGMLFVASPFSQIKHGAKSSVRSDLFVETTTNKI
jgi:hypothetical protein